MTNGKLRKYQDMDLRRGIDHIGVCVIFYCHDGKGKLLLHKRSKNCRDEVGCWDVGGGAVEFGEDLEEALFREIQEEYCTKPRRFKFIKPFNAVRQNGKLKTHWLALVYVVELDPKEVKIGDLFKMDKIGWFNKNHLPEPIHSMFQPFYKFVKDEIF